MSIRTFLSDSTGFTRFFILVTALFASQQFSSVGHCDLVLGNMAAHTNDNGALVGFDKSGGYSIGFTALNDITITGVDLRLRGNVNSGIATLDLRTDVGGNPNSNLNERVLFGNQAVTSTFGTINFTPTSSMRLSAGSKYWLTIGNQFDSTPLFDGLVIGANDPSITPSGPYASFEGLRTGSFDNQNLDPTQFPVPVNIPTFAIEGTVTAVPEPSSFIPCALGFGILAWYRRRKKRSPTPGS